MPYKFGDIVLVRFPFTTQAAFKQRPAVVVSNVAYNSARPDVMIMAVTSQLSPQLGAGDVMIRAWQSANLLKPSMIKPVIATIEQGLILKQLGSLEAVDQTALRNAIAAVIG